MKYIYILILLISSTLSLSADSIKNEFTSSFETYSKQLKTIQCDFTQTRSAAYLNAEVYLKGKLYYDAAGYICLDYSQPKGDKIVFSGNDFMIVNAGKKTIANINSNPMLKELSTMLSACMSGDISALIDSWNISYSKIENEYILVLLPKDKRVKRKVEQMILGFNASDLSLNTMQMFDSQSGISAYNFNNKQLNKPIDKSHFIIK